MSSVITSKQNIFSDNNLLKRILHPYKEDCHYLKSAVIEYPLGFNFPLAKGQFSIPYSCYIQDTGHFNAVEFNICYNQLAYYLLAECIQNKLLDSLKAWDMEIYTRRQLADILIVRFSSVFKKPINPRQFAGYIRIEKIFKKNKLLYIQTTCDFNDDNRGSATGNVLFVIPESIVNCSS